MVGQDEGPQGGAAGDAGRILLLDDDEAVGRLVTRMLETVGMQCIHASHYSEFCRFLDSWRPTHILLDLMMPDMDGVEVMGKLAERQCSAHVILVSGAGSQVLEAARRAANANGLNVAGVVAKPLSGAKLKRIFDKCAQACDSTHAQARRAPAYAISDADIEHAIRTQAFSLAYQPKVRCRGGGLIGFEALIRWKRRDQMIPPDSFIGLAEKSGRIVTITRLVIEQGIEWLSRYARDSIALSLNMSAACLKDAEFADHLISVCKQFGVEPARIVLELTETVAADDPVNAVNMLTRLRLRGVQLSIDDFGTGYSSMAQLADLPFTEVKVDKSFVITALDSERSRSIIRSTVDLAHELELRVTAEGVESEQVLRYLRDIGCDYAQGYYIARPMDGDAAHAWTISASGLGSASASC